MRNFRKLDIGKNGIEIVKQVYKLSERLPPEKKFGLRSQITRAAVSIPSNIAEGCSRNSEIEFKLKFVSQVELESTFELLTKEARMINSLISKIKNS